MGRGLFDFLRREDGVVAVIFAVMAIPFIAMAGWAVDYVRIQHVKEYLQAQVDAAALSAHVWDDGGRTADQQWSLVHDATKAEIDRQYQGDWARNVDLSPFWIDQKTIRVTAHADVPLAFINIVPGIPDTQRVEVSAISQANTVAREYNIKVSELDYDAGDYNKIWAYCYWPNRPANDPAQPKRTQMVPIADNGGPANRRNVFDQDEGDAPQLKGADAIVDSQLRQIYQKVLTDNPLHGYNGQEEGAWRVVSGAGTNSRKYLYIAPLCEGDSYLSFRLENVRFAREKHQYWEAGDQSYQQGGPRNSGGDGHYGRYDYYTDSVLDASTGIEGYQGLKQKNPAHGNADILETVICDTEDQCNPRKSGNIIPKGTGRQEGSQNPRQRASQKCDPGKFMYYGFEDRPPGLPGRSDNWQYEAWTDADYDDIRIIISCPEIISTGERNARLIG